MDENLIKQVNVKTVGCPTGSNNSSGGGNTGGGGDDSFLDVLITLNETMDSFEATKTLKEITDEYYAGKHICFSLKITGLQNVFKQIPWNIIENRGASAQQVYLNIPIGYLYELRSANVGIYITWTFNGSQENKIVTVYQPQNS